MKMKSIIKYFVFACFLYLTGCEDNNSLHQKYLDEGEIYYIGMLDSLEIFPGKERVRFSWTINADPRIVGTNISWDEGKESVTIPIVRKQSGNMRMDTIINVAEGIYVFTLANVDREGAKSKGVEGSTVVIYGAKYAENLQTRLVNSMTLNGTTLTIRWNSSESLQIQHTLVRYTDYTDANNPSSKTVTVSNEDSQTVIENVRAGDIFSVITTYLPNNGIDTIDTLPIEYIVQ